MSRGVEPALRFSPPLGREFAMMGKRAPVKKTECV